MRQFLVSLALILCFGCATSPVQQGIRLNAEGRHEEAIATLQDWAARNPDDHRVWRELGIAQYHQGNYERAQSLLEQAASIRDDARTRLYLGALLERTGQEEAAVAEYNRALTLPGSKQTKEMLRAHLFTLLRNKAIAEAKAALARESALETGQAPENSISVTGFDSEYLQADLAPLALGLAELISVDLSKVKALIVTERMKIALLQKELELSQTKYVEGSSRLQLGKLIRSNWIVSGSLRSAQDSQNIEFVAVLDRAEDGFQRELHSENELDRFFKLEKRIVFGVIEQLGIELSPEERASIEEVPTESTLALLAYSKGLDRMYDGDYAEAETDFQAAAEADPYFQDAQAKARLMGEVNVMNSNAAATGASGEEAVLAQSDKDESPKEQESALSNLIDQSPFIPASQEGDASGDAIVDNPPRTGTPGTIDISVTGTIE